MIALAVVVLLGGVAGIWVGSSRLGSSSTTRAEGSAPATSGGLAQPSGQEPTEPEPPPAAGSTASSPPSRSAYRCWNGTSRQSLASCGSPYRASEKTKSSLTGLNWVFKDRAKRLDSYDPSCSNRTLRTRTLHRQCFFDYEGTDVCINWSQFDSVSDGLDNYATLGSPSSRPFGSATELVWSPTAIDAGPCRGLPYKTARMIEGERWGVAAYASDQASATAALDQFGEFRPVEQWSGVPG